MSIAATISGPDDTDAIDTGQPQSGTTEQPRKIESDQRPSAIPTIDPFTVRDAGNDPTDRGPGNGGDGPKRRGRPPGSRNKTGTEKEKTVSSDLKVNIEDLLLSTHQMLATFFDAKELELDPDEAKDGAHHLKELSKLYNHTINPATLVWMGFIFWVLTVYGTRGVAIYKRVSADKPAPKLGPVAVPKKTDTVPASEKVDLSSLAPSQLWNEPPIDG